MEPSKSIARFRSSLGTFSLTGYEIDGREHAVLVCGNPAGQEAPLVRVQSSCLTGTAFLAELCDCRQQLHLAMSTIEEEGSGIVMYLDQEGRSHGLVEKIAQLDLIAGGADTVDAAAERGREADLRTYEIVERICSDILGTGHPIRLLTNNPEKIARIREAGVDVTERVALEVAPTDGNREYLRVKKARMGHLLTKV